MDQDASLIHVKVHPEMDSNPEWSRLYSIVKTLCKKPDSKIVIIAQSVDQLCTHHMKW